MQVKQIQQRKTSWMMQQIHLQHCWLITVLWIYFNLSSIYLSMLIKFFFWLFVLFLKLQEHLECRESIAQSQKVPSLRANISSSFNPKQMMEWRSKVRGDRLNWCPVWQKTLTLHSISSSSNFPAQRSVCESRREPTFPEVSWAFPLIQGGKSTEIWQNEEETGWTSAHVHCAHQ